jgi:cell division protein FtsB
MSPDAKNSAELPGDPRPAAKQPRLPRRRSWVLIVVQVFGTAAILGALIASWIQRDREFEQIRQLEAQLKQLEAQCDRLQKECDRLQKEGLLPARDQRVR